MTRRIQSVERQRAPTGTAGPGQWSRRWFPRWRAGAHRHHPKATAHQQPAGNSRPGDHPNAPLSHSKSGCEPFHLSADRPHCDNRLEPDRLPDTRHRNLDAADTRRGRVNQATLDQDRQRKPHSARSRADNRGQPVNRTPEVLAEPQRQQQRPSSATHRAKPAMRPVDTHKSTATVRHSEQISMS